MGAMHEQPKKAGGRMRKSILQDYISDFPKKTNAKASRLLSITKELYFENMPKNTALKSTTSISTTVFRVRLFNDPKCNDF